MISRFSIGWCFLFTALNIAGCVFLIFIAFGTAMSAFSEPSSKVQSSLAIVEFISWIWTTGTMIAFRVFGITLDKGLPAITLLWAFVVGTIAGFIMPRIFAKSSRNQGWQGSTPLRKPSNPKQW